MSRGFGFNAAEPSSQPPPRDEDLILPGGWDEDADPHDLCCDCWLCELVKQHDHERETSDD